MNTAEFLRERGIQPSQQRVRIYEALAATRSHPAADGIHRGLSPEMSTLSRTTVHSTLRLFVERGIAQELAITGTELRFDADTSPHAHFACRSCGQVSDVPGPLVSPALPAGFRGERFLVSVWGLCPACGLGGGQTREEEAGTPSRSPTGGKAADARPGKRRARGLPPARRSREG